MTVQTTNIRGYTIKMTIILILSLRIHRKIPTGPWCMNALIHIVITGLILRFKVTAVLQWEKVGKMIRILPLYTFM